MKAAMYEEYGSPEVVELREIEKPEPNDDEVLIKVYATTVTSGDRRVRSFDLPSGFGLVGRLALGLTGPRKKILGTELAGIVESVGAKVEKFKVGDEVFAFSDFRMGCHAEYKSLPEDSAIALKPPNLTFGEAAAMSFGGTTALHFFRKAKLKEGEKVLINGASGGVGSAAVQLARHFGAHITGVCSTANLELVRSLGADDVIDYTSEDFTENGVYYDLIVDIAGTAPFSRSKASLKQGGRLALVLAGLTDSLKAPWVSMTSNKKVITGVATGDAEDLRLLARLAEDEEFRPVIDGCYSFEDIAEAHRRVDTGHKRGNVIINVVPEQGRRPSPPRPSV